MLLNSITMSELVSTWNTGQLFFLQSLHSSRSAYWWPFYVEPKCHSITPHPPVCAAKGGGGRGLWHLFLCVYRLFCGPCFWNSASPFPLPALVGIEVLSQISIPVVWYHQLKGPSPWNLIMSLFHQKWWPNPWTLIEKDDIDALVFGCQPRIVAVSFQV